MDASYHTPDLFGVRSREELPGYIPGRVSLQERIRTAVKRRKEKDPEAFNANLREWHNKKYASDPIYKQARQHRGLVWSTLRGVNRSKLPYTPAELRAHLESLWKPDMSWDNYAKKPDGWCVDHIVPISDFTRAGIFEPSIVSALSNLRPCWYFENGSKGSKADVTRPIYTAGRNPPKGEKHYKAQLTIEQVREIKTALKEGFKYGTGANLARKYGVSPRIICHIHVGNSWKHVTLD